MEDDPHGFLRSLRAFATRRRGETMLLGEVNAELKALSRFFGDEDGDQLNAQFAFLLNQNLWLSLAREDAEPLEAVIRTLPDRAARQRWATFLRNHDELSLDKLTESQRKEVFEAFGPRKDMQLYGHGLRRRTATMLGGDGPRLRMAWSLMLSLPGTPVIFMGDEIGMGENLVDPGPHERPRADAVVGRAGTAASRARPRRSSCGRCGAAASARSTSTSPRSAATTTRCSTSSSG